MTTIVGTPQTTDYGFSDTRDAVALPAGIQAGDVIWFVLTTANAHTLGVIPDGVLQAGTTQNAAGDDSSTSVLYRIANGLEGATFNLGAIFSTAESGGVLAFALRGLSTSDLIEAVAQAAPTIAGAAETVSGPSVSPVNSNCTILQILGCDPGVSAIGGTPDASPVATEIFDGKIDTGDFGYVYAQMYDQTTAAPLALDVEFDYGPLNFSAFQIALNQGVAGLSITNIDTDNVVLDGQTGARISFNGDIGTVQGTVALANAGETFSVDQTVTAWVQGDGLTTGYVDITAVQGGLPFTDDLVLVVTPDGGSAVKLTGVTLSVPANNAAVDVVNPVTDDTSIFFQVQNGVPATGQQIQHTDSGATPETTNTTTNPDGTFTQALARNFQARVWDVDNTWSPWVTVNVSEAGTVIVVPGGRRIGVRPCIQDFIRAAVGPAIHGE